MVIRCIIFLLVFWSACLVTVTMAGEQVGFSSQDALVIASSKSVKIIQEGRGQHSDPDVVDAFMDISEDFRKIAIKHADFEDEINALKN